MVQVRYQKVNRNVDKLRKIIEDAHVRMTAPLKKQSVTVEIPLAVQALLSEPIPTITWEF